MLGSVPERKSMSRSGAATRREYDSPLARRKRDTLPARSTTSCIEVQWKFLAKSPIRNATNPNSTTKTTGNQQSSFAYRTTSVDTPSQPTEPSRVLEGLLGETQRQAALDRIMAEMHDLVAQPSGMTGGRRQTQDHLDDPPSQSYDRRKRSVVVGAGDLLESLKSGEIGAATLSLLPQRKRSALGNIADSRSTNDDDDDDDDDEIEEVGANKQVAGSGGGGGGGGGGERTNGVVTSFCPPTDTARSRSRDSTVPRRRWKSNCAAEDDGITAFVWQKSTTAHFADDLPSRLDASKSAKIDNLRAAATISSPPAASRATYGAWYVPRHQWWPLRQLQQQQHDELGSLASRDEPHCHRGAPHQRQHKPPLPPAAASSPRPSCRQHSPSPPLPPPSLAPASASGSAGLEIQLATSYIGREYRSFVLASGSPLPHYLEQS